MQLLAKILKVLMLIKVIKCGNYIPFSLSKTVSVVCYNSQNSRYLEFSSFANLTHYMFSYAMQSAALLNINLNLSNKLSNI